MFMHILDIESGLCNLRCKYCYLSQGGIEETIRKGQNIYTKQNNQKLHFDYSVEYLVGRVKVILDKIKASMLVVLGGELFLLPEILDLLVEKSNQYHKIRIITNGVSLHKYNLSKMKSEKFIFQVSLDGLDMNSNHFRFSSKNYLNKILNNLEYLYKNGYIIEINCVLTERNIDNFKEFAFFIKNKFPEIIIYPYPVRFFEDKYLIKLNQIDTIKNWINEKEIVDVLPPSSYFTEMIKAINAEKTCKCYLPVIALSGSEDGSSNLCPCAMLENMGNIFNDDFVFNSQIRDKGIKNVFHFKYDFCIKCFTHFDIINLFIEDKITEQEMMNIGVFRDNYILQELIKEKEKIKREIIKNE